MPKVDLWDCIVVSDRQKARNLQSLEVGTVVQCRPGSGRPVRSRHWNRGSVCGRAHWLQRLIYYELSAWVFTVVYTAFALLVVLAWWRFPPRREPRKRNDAWPSGHCH